MEQKKRRPASRMKKILLIMLAVVVVLVCGAIALFLDELRIISTIRRVDAPKPFYTMQVDGDYHFAEFLNAGGAASDAEVSAFLTGKISQGFYTVDVENTGLACSTLAAKTPDGTHVWGRNFDWDASVPIIVTSRPKDGYASIATCDFKNITNSAEARPEGIANQMLAIAALYVPMDGMNEAGLCVADLEVNEGGMLPVDTDKPDLTVTTALRLLLNKAATVEQAVELLGQYDIHASGGISHHIAIADASGASVAVEFVEGAMVVVDTPFVTNFNLANGDTAAGGENSQERYETLRSAYDTNKGVFTTAQMQECLAAVSQASEKQSTQWSIVFDHASLTATYYFGGDYDNAYRYAIELR